MHLHGIPIYITNHLGWEEYQYRFPRSKKKRIRKKWTKNRENWKRIQKPVCYMVQDPAFLGNKKSQCYFANDAFLWELQKQVGMASLSILKENRQPFYMMDV